MRIFLFFFFILLGFSNCSDSETQIPDNYDLYSSDYFKRYDNVDLYAEDALLMQNQSILIKGTGRRNNSVCTHPYLLQIDNQQVISSLTFFELDRHCQYRPILLSSSNDGGFMSINEVYNDNTSDVNIMMQKIDINGVVEWEKELGELSFSEKIVSFTQLPSNDYILLGRNKRNFPPFDSYFLLKLSSTGEVIWSRLINDELTTSLRKVIFSPTNNNIFILSEQGAYWNDEGVLKITKLDSEANILESKNIVGNADFFISDSNMKTLKNGNILVYSSTKQSNSNGKYKSNIFMFDTALNEVWSSTYDDFDSSLFSDIIEKENGHLLILSKDNNINNDEFDIILTEMDEAGTILWGKIYGGIASDQGSNIILKNNGDLTIIGNTNEQSKTEANFNLFLLKTDAEGNPK